MRKTGRKTCYGSTAGRAYAFRVDGVDGAFLGQIFGRQIDSLHKLKAFQDQANHVTYVKGSQKAVKEWVKENKPSQFLATWICETPFYREDSIEIFYTKEEEHK